MNIFSHSGDIGDIIYSLPTIRAKGGGKLILFDCPGKTAHGMTKEKVERLRSLLEYQDYIHALEWSDTLIESSLNGFRDQIRDHGSLADAHLATHGFSWEERAKPWLKCDGSTTTYDVVVHRSFRYNNKNFPWGRIVDTYKDRMGFVGFPDEYKKFTDSFGKIPFIEANDFMELAKVIKGCKLYIGNQSSPLSIALGMFHNCIIEVCPDHNHHHCIFQRMNCIIGWDKKIILPDLESLC
jgi:hypothetical protein